MLEKIHHKKKTIEQLEELSSTELGDIITSMYYEDEFDLNYIETLLKCGADIEISIYSDCYVSIIHAICFNLSYDVLKIFIKYGADLEIRDYVDRTPLHQICHKANTLHKYKLILLIEILISSGASLEAQDYGGWTPLHLAAFRSNHTAVGAFLAAGANISATTNSGDTPWALASSTIREQIPELKPNA